MSIPLFTKSIDRSEFMAHFQCIYAFYPPMKNENYFLFFTDMSWIHFSFFFVCAFSCFNKINFKNRNLPSMDKQFIFYAWIHIFYSLCSWSESQQSCYFMFLICWQIKISFIHFVGKPKKVIYFVWFINPSSV